MQTRISKLAQIAAGAVVLSMAFALPAAAKHRYTEAHWHRHHHHHRHFAYNDRPITVTSPDPFHGPAAIITGPNAVAATIVSLPFRAANTIFPPYGNTPLVLIGAPVHAAGMVAEFPFYAVGTAFGAPPHIVY